jgi:hypothetical protein
MPPADRGPRATSPPSSKLRRNATHVVTREHKTGTLVDHEIWLAGVVAGVVTVRPAAAWRPGMPRWTVVARRAVIWSIWESLARAWDRLTFRPSASPSQWFASASVIGAARLSQMWTRRGRWAGRGAAAGGAGRSARGCRGSRSSGRSCRGRVCGAGSFSAPSKATRRGSGRARGTWGPANILCA